MQGNWAALVLLVVAVLILALVKARRAAKEDEEDADTPDGEAAETSDGSPSQPEREGESGTPVEPDGAEVSWEECQRQLTEEPPAQECDRVEFLPMNEADFDPDLVPEIEVEPVPESRHAANIQIRREAGRLFRENYREILPLSLIVVALTAIRLYAPLITLPEPWSTGWGFFNLGGLAALIAPVVTLGATYAALRIWNGEAPRPAMVFHFLQNNRYFPALFMMLLQILILAIPQAMLVGATYLIQRIITSIRFWSSAAFEAYDFSVSVSLFLPLATAVWLIGCMMMASFAIARQSVFRVFAALGTGFRAVHRNFKRALGMLIAVGWPFAASILTQYICASWSNLLHTVWFYRASEILNLLLILFYGGYFLLSMAGLADQLLPDADGAPAEALHAEDIPADAMRAENTSNAIAPDDIAPADAACAKSSPNAIAPDAPAAMPDKNAPGEGVPSEDPSRQTMEPPQ